LDAQAFGNPQEESENKWLQLSSLFFFHG